MFSSPSQFAFIFNVSLDIVVHCPLPMTRSVPLLEHVSNNFPLVSVLFMRAESRTTGFALRE